MKTTELQNYLLDQAEFTLSNSIPYHIYNKYISLTKLDDDSDKYLIKYTDRNIPDIIENLNSIPYNVISYIFNTKSANLIYQYLNMHNCLVTANFICDKILKLDDRPAIISYVKSDTYYIITIEYGEFKIKCRKDSKYISTYDYDNFIKEGVISE